jgi:hypothetical protein
MKIHVVLAVLVGGLVTLAFVAEVAAQGCGCQPTTVYSAPAPAVTVAPTVTYYAPAPAPVTTYYAPTTTYYAPAPVYAVPVYRPLFPYAGWRWRQAYWGWGVPVVTPY